MTVDNKDLNNLLKKAVGLQPPKKPMKFSIWKRIKINIRLWYILFKSKHK